MNGRGQSFRLGLSSRQKTVTEQWGHTCCMPQLGNAYLMAVLHQTAWAHLLYKPTLHSILGRHCTPCFMGHPVHGPVPQSSQGTDCMPFSTEHPCYFLLLPVCFTWDNSHLFCQSAFALWLSVSCCVLNLTSKAVTKLPWGSSGAIRRSWDLITVDYFPLRFTIQLLCNTHPWVLLALHAF